MKRFSLTLDDVRLGPDALCRVTLQADLSGHARLNVKPYDRKEAYVATLADVALWMVESRKGERSADRS